MTFSLYVFMLMINIFQHSVTLENLKKAMITKFAMTHLDIMKYFLGIQVLQTKGESFISKKKKKTKVVKKNIEKFHLLFILSLQNFNLHFFIFFLTLFFFFPFFFKYIFFSSFHQRQLHHKINPQTCFQLYSAIYKFTRM